MNIIQELTKDCDREDCEITGGDMGYSTAMGWAPTYDKNGNRTDRGDPNIHTVPYRCRKCGRAWNTSTQYGETTIHERKAP